MKNRKVFKLWFILFLSCPVLSQTTFTSVITGNWDDGSTWGNSGSVQGTDWPARTDHVVIASGHTVTMQNIEKITNLTIDAGGVLDDDNQGAITVDGNLVLNGTKTGNRNIQFTGGSGQTIDGSGVHNSTKDIKINGNATILSTAYLTVIKKIDIAAGVTVTNYGTVIINNDLKGNDATTSIWINAANSTLECGKNLLAVGTLTASAPGNIVKYSRKGDADIKIPSGTPATYYNLTIDGTGVKTMLADLVITNDLLINSSTLETDAVSNYDLNIGGDFTNSSTLNENTATVTFDGTGAQTITNSTGETFYDLTINKASGTLSLANDVIVSNTLTMTAGVTDAGANKLTLGTGTGNEGTLSYTGGQIVSQFERWIANTTTSIDIDFPIGSVSNMNAATINFTGITTGGTVLFQFVESDPGNSGLSLVDGAATIYNSFVDGYWDMTIANGFKITGGQSFNLDLDGSGFSAFTMDAATRLLIRSSAASAWTTEGTHATVASPVAIRTGLSTMGAQYAFGDDTNCTGPTTSAITGSTEVCTDDTSIAYSVTDNGNTYTWTITGGTQVSGGTTASIIVDWGSTGQVGNVKVVETNGCTNGAAVNLSVNINSIAPSYISGGTSVAELTADKPYSVTDLGYTYTWTIAGGTLDTGQGTSNITVDWGSAGTGNISVVAQKAGCAAATAINTDVLKYFVINSATSGPWDDPSTWTTGTVPLTTENARVLNTHIVEITGDETIGNFIVNAGGTLDAATSNKKLKVDGDFTLNGTYNGGTKQLELNGINTIIDGTGTINITGQNVDINNGNKTIASTAVLNITDGDMNLRDANITITNNGSITIATNLLDVATSVWINASSSTLKVGGTVLLNGTLDASASENTVNYNGTGAQNIKNASSSTYHHLTLSTSGTKTALATLDVNGDLTIDGTATFNAATNTADLTVGGDWTNNGTFTQGSQSVTLDGSSGQTIGGTTTTVFNDLIFNNTGAGIVLNAPVTIDGTASFTAGIVTSDVTNFITITSNGTTNAGNATSYVDGKIAKVFAGAGSITFPTGNGGVWAPIGALNVSAPATFEAQYFFSAYSDLTLDATFSNVSDLEYWQLDQTSGTATADVRLYYKDQVRSGISDVISNDVIVAKYTGATWTADGFYAGANLGNQTADYVDVTTVTSFSPFTLGSEFGNNALPVELVYFRGKLHSNGLALTWQTASELNNDFFEVEVSTDGENYSTLAIIEGQGTTTFFTNYEYLDRYPASGLNYYRLRQVDFNGEFTYSNIISVMNDAPARLYYSAFPQPASSQLTLQLSPIDDTSVMNLIIYNVNGRIIKNFSIDPKTKQLPIDISTYMNGIYFIHLNQAEEAYRGRLLIQK